MKPFSFQRHGEATPVVATPAAIETDLVPEPRQPINELGVLAVEGHEGDDNYTLARIQADTDIFLDNFTF